MKKSWWKVPLYCIIASWVCFQLQVHFLAKWAMETLPDGTISINNTRWMLMSAALFLAVVCIGGFLFFRKMTHREIFCSASVLVGLNIVLGLFTNISPRLSILWSEFSDWDGVFTQLLIQFGLNIWLSAAITWLLPPYIFVLFGKRENRNK